MTEKEIFEYLFSISCKSNDTKGVVVSGLVRDGKILAEGVSDNSGVHSEYAVLQQLNTIGESVRLEDIFYTTVEPCGKRTPGGRGEKMGDCTTNLIKAGVKKVVYAAADPDASKDSRQKFIDAGVDLRQTLDKEIIQKAVKLFNSTNSDFSGHLS